jgi:hypothetical protein
VANGWNLIGNSTDTAITAAATFGDPGKVMTVWKWVPATTGTAAGWAFYSPTIPDGGAAYAASKGYSFLTTINAGEGFWINAAAAFSAPFPTGSAVVSTSFKPSVTFGGSLVAGGAHALPSGWSLVSTGDNPTPDGFNFALRTVASTPPAAGTSQVYTNLTTLWAWSVTGGGGWYFWAPSAVNTGTLASVLQSKNYLDFGSTGTLAPGVGFWVNMP